MDPASHIPLARIRSFRRVRDVRRKVQGPFRKWGYCLEGSFFPKDELPPVHIFLESFRLGEKQLFMPIFFIEKRGDVWTEGESFKQVRPKVGKWDRCGTEERGCRLFSLLPPSHASSAMHRYIMQIRRKTTPVLFLVNQVTPRALFSFLSEKPDNFS